MQASGSLDIYETAFEMYNVANENPTSIPNRMFTGKRQPKGGEKVL
jgi:hypothetical protein